MSFMLKYQTDLSVAECVERIKTIFPKGYSSYQYEPIQYSKFFNTFKIHKKRTLPTLQLNSSGRKRYKHMNNAFAVVLNVNMKVEKGEAFVNISRGNLLLNPIFGLGFLLIATFFYVKSPPEYRSDISNFIDYSKFWLIFLGMFLSLYGVLSLFHKVFRLKTYKEEDVLKVLENALRIKKIDLDEKDV